MSVSIAAATAADVPRMVAMSERARAEYARWEPVFYRRRANAAELQTRYFEYLLKLDTTIALLGETSEGGEGLIIATFESPPMYDAGSPAALIHDFVVSDDALWASLGAALLDEVSRQATARGASAVIGARVTKDAG